MLLHPIQLDKKAYKKLSFSNKARQKQEVLSTCLVVFYPSENDNLY